MKRFIQTFKEGEKVVRLVITTYEKEDVLAAIGSGTPWKEPQYLFLDYDTNYQRKEWEFIVETYELRRALIVESSPERYWFLSFSPMHIADICEIMYHSTSDKRHCVSLFKEGLVSIRLTRKQKQTGYPKIVKVTNNPKGKTFYDFNKEKLFRGILRSFHFDKEKVFKRLIGGDKE